MYNGGIYMCVHSTHVEVRGQHCEYCPCFSAYVGSEIELGSWALDVFTHSANSPVPTLSRDIISLWPVTYQVDYAGHGPWGIDPFPHVQITHHLTKLFNIYSGDTLRSSCLPGKHFTKNLSTLRHAFLILLDFYNPNVHDFHLFFYLAILKSFSV